MNTHLKTVLLGKYNALYEKMFYLHVFNNITDYIAFSLSVCSLDEKAKYYLVSLSRMQNLTGLSTKFYTRSLQLVSHTSTLKRCSEGVSTRSSRIQLLFAVYSVGVYIIYNDHTSLALLASEASFILVAKKNYPHFPCSLLDNYNAPKV